MIDEKVIKQDIAIDESIERIIRVIHENVIKFYQEYVDFNGRASFYTDLKKFENRLNKSVSKIVEIKNICKKEFNEFINQNKYDEDMQIIKDLRIMIMDLEQYSEKLEFIMARILNNNIINTEKYKVEINSLFRVIFEKYDEFVKADDDVVIQLAKLENRIKLTGIKR